MLHIRSPKGLSPTGVGPRIMLVLLPLVIAASIATVNWPEVTRFPTRPNAPIVAGGFIWLVLGLALWGTTVRRFLRGFRLGELITDGPFAYCRNPLYASLTLFVLPAIGLITESWTFLVVAAMGAALVVASAKDEERELSRVFGQAFTDYASRTGALIPLPSRTHRVRRFGARVLWGFALVSFVYFGALRTWHLGWGATHEEKSRALPGDDFVRDAQYRSTHAISIRAPAERVWPWIAQLGWDRGGLYSYAWLENLFGCQMKNADTIVAEWQDVHVGDPFRIDRRIPAFKVALVGAPYAFVVASGDVPTSAAWQFIVVPVSRNESRLLVRWKSALPPGFVAELFGKTLLEPIHFMMEERMLRGIKERAESLRADPLPPPDALPTPEGSPAASPDGKS